MDVKQVPPRLEVVTPYYEVLPRGEEGQKRNKNSWENLGEGARGFSFRMSNADAKIIEDACAVLGGVKITSFIRQAAVNMAKSIMEN